MYLHYLTPLLAPRSVALIGASERPGSLGRIVFENLLQGGLRGPVYPINPKRESLLGHRCHASIRELPEPPELAVVVTPAATIPQVLDEAGAAGTRNAVVLTSGFGEAGEAGKALLARVMAAAHKHRMRVLGPNCLGLMRPSIGLNATFARGFARPGKLALVSQSGAICTAILDWANGAEIGFSSVISLGSAADIDFGELLDFLASDPRTEAILMYIEGIRDARRFLSALRAAARSKPVIALKVGRYAAGTKAVSSHTAALVGSDEVFNAALTRSGTVRVRTYTQLFAAARVLSNPRRARGERLAIVTNGGGPGVMAADSAAENGVQLAVLSPETLKRLDGVLPGQWSRSNPVDILGDAAPERFTAAMEHVLADDGVDAALVMYCPVAVTAPEEAARALAKAVEGQDKPVLSAWLGDIRPSESRSVLEAAHIPDFYTPENAVEAFSFLSAYRRNQSQLLEVPAALESSSPAEARPDLAAAEAIRARAVAESRSQLTEDEAKALLQVFGVPVPASILATTAGEALAAAAKIGFPVAMKIRSRDILHKTDVGGVRLNLIDDEMVAGAFNAILAKASALRPDAQIDGVVVQPMLRHAHSREVLVGISTDPVFGPVITFGSGGVAVEAVRDTAIALPPLNSVLVGDLMQRTRIFRLLRGYRDVPPADLDALSNVVQGISRMVCALPWLKEMDLNPVIAHPGGATVADARATIDLAAQKPPGRYAHMAIHPYPGELEETIALRDGTALKLRAIRPDDAGREQRFFNALSERSRYLRFQHHLPKLSPLMVERFTQLDYDRELALVALDPGADEFLAVGRYAPNPDGTTAEFAMTVADAWQGRGLGNALLQRLCGRAREAGYEALVGYVLAENRDMLDLAVHLGFVQGGREGDAAVVRRDLNVASAD